MYSILFAVMITITMVGIGSTDEMGEYETGQIQDSLGIGIPQIWPEEGDVAEIEKQIAKHEAIIKYLNHLRNQYLQGSQTKRSGFFNRRSGNNMYDVDWHKIGDYAPKRSGFFNRKRSGYEERK